MGRAEGWTSGVGRACALISATRGLTDLALAAIASRASFPTVVTPRVARAKSGVALTLPSPLTAIDRSGLNSIRRGWAEIAEGRAVSAATNAIRHTRRECRMISSLLPKPQRAHARDLTSP